MAVVTIFDPNRGDRQVVLPMSLSRQLAVPGVSPGTINNDNVLAVFSLPAGTFDIAGRGIIITGAGSFAATANAKTIKVIFNATTAVVGSAVTGGTTVATTGSQTTNSNGTGFLIGATVFKLGAAGSNTQVGFSNGAIAGTVHLGVGVPASPVAVESGAILVAITGNAVTATTDIFLDWFEVTSMN